MDVYKEYSQSLKREFVTIEAATEKLLAALDAGNYNEAREWAEAIKLKCSFYSAQVAYRERQDANDANA